jgi:hypothetical protein
MYKSNSDNGKNKQGQMQYFLLGLFVGAAGYYAYELYNKPKPTTPTTTNTSGGTPRTLPAIEERPSITSFASNSGGGCGCKGNGVTIITAGNVAGIPDRV